MLRPGGRSVAKDGLKCGSLPDSLNFGFDSGFPRQLQFGRLAVQFVATGKPRILALRLGPFGLVRWWDAIRADGLQYAAQLRVWGKVCVFSAKWIVFVVC